MANTRDTLGDQATLDGLINHTLTEFEENGVASVASYAFNRNSGLQSVRFPNLTTASTYVFQYCTALKSIAKEDFPLMTSIGNYMFAYCSALEEAEFPSANSVGTYAFRSDTNLEKLRLTGTGTKTINANAFNGCSKLAHLVINSSSMSTLSNTSAFTGTPIALGNGAIYVPSGLIANYKANSNWKNYFIVSIDSYPLADFSSIQDSWSEILAAEADGTYKEKYKLGDTKAISLGTFGTIYMQIIAFDKDIKADGTGTAPITWLAKTIITTHNMNSSSTTSGGWSATAMRSYLKDTIKPLIPETVRNAIIPVTKVSSTYESNAVVVNGQTTTDDVWIPSEYEMFGTTTYESEGATYSDYFTSNAMRIKYNSAGSANGWWLRSADSSLGFRCVISNGRADGGYGAVNALGLVLGFCT